MSDAAKILAIAAGEVGTKEKFEGGHWVNNSKYNRWFGKIPGYSQDGYGWPWCAAFVTWVAHEADLPSLYPKTAGCATAVAWFKNKGRFSEYPAIGAQVFFGSGGGSHTGIVYKYDATYAYTIEGNTNLSGSAEGDGVYKRSRLRRDSYLYGYGYPEFSEGIVTADPSKKGKKGFTYKASASAPAAPAKPTAPSGSDYVVKEGDTLSSIGDKLNVPWTQLASVNKIKAPYVIKPGQKLKVTGPTVSAPKPKPVSYEPFPGAAYFRKNPNSSLIERLGKRLVQEGCSAYQVGPTKQWTESDRKSYRKWQLKLGYRGSDADGYPGKASWDKLKVPKA
jgi:hypothetical protein